MGKSVLFLCAAGAAFAVTAFVLPHSEDATAAVRDAGPGRQTAVQVAPEVPGMAQRFHAEKLRAVQQPLPAQF
jgi:hypothetical protein